MMPALQGLTFEPSLAPKLMFGAEVYSLVPKLLMSNSDFPPSVPFEILTKAARMRIAKFRYTLLILSLVDRFSDVMEIKYVLINLDFIKTDAFLSFNHPGSNTSFRKRFSRK